MSEMTNLLEQTRQLAESGFSVIPIKADKGSRRMVIPIAGVEDEKRDAISD